jgi:outer membrane lipoprotein-sorting protein
MIKKLLSFIAIYFLFLNIAKSQNDLKAQTILFEAYQKYKTYKNVRISFSTKIENLETKKTTNYEGKGYIEGVKYFIEYPEETILSDGKSIWSYPKSKKVVKIIEYNPNDGMLTPDEIFREDFIKSGLVYKYVKEEKDNTDLTGKAKKLDVIDFFPKENNRKYVSFRVWIDQNTKLITSWHVIMKNLSTLTYQIRLVPNDKIVGNPFVFDKTNFPKDVKIIDLRKK